MSTIYSAGQYEDAFNPKRLGNWESTAKESHPFRKETKLHTPKIIVDSRGHLLPWVPRKDPLSSWGLLNIHLRSKYKTRSMAFVSGSGKIASSATGGQPPLSIQRRLKKLPRYKPRNMEYSVPSDLLLEYLQHLSLPIVWIIGPPTKITFQKRRQFCKQLASSLRFGYVNLDEKIQEWKDRQQICTCGSKSSLCNIASSSSPPHGPLHSLASTSIAPSKLPTNVPPFISPNIPSPPGTSEVDANEYLLKILESQRVTFDTALPIERNKILELYKFAMAECLPCEGFIMDSVPFDLVEGLQFEKVFYPAALAIYFTEGVPLKRQKVKPKDRRVTADTTTSFHSQKRALMSPLSYLERSRKHGENVYMKAKSHKRLGVFNLAEGEKICKQFGSKTIRIVNAEDVERETMEFIIELVKKNLQRYQDIMDGNFTLDVGYNVSLAPPSPTYSSNFISEEDERAMEQKEELDRMEKFIRNRNTMSAVRVNSNNMPPALVTAHSPHQSETSLFTLPNIFNTSSESSSLESSVAASPRPIPTKEVGRIEDSAVEEDINTLNEANLIKSPPAETVLSGDTNRGAGDQLISSVPERTKSAELWDRIIKLESKVAELNTPEEACAQPTEEEQNYAEDFLPTLPPPTAYAEREEDLDTKEKEKLTAAIRNAISPDYITAMAASEQQNEFQYAPTYFHPAHDDRLQLPTEYDFGASGDCGHGLQNNMQQREAPNYHLHPGISSISNRQKSKTNQQQDTDRPPSH